MQARSAESPMDFEWSNPTETSSFTFKSSFAKSLDPAAFNTPTKKRTFQATDSPPKPLNPTAKQFGNVMPVTTGSPQNPFLFSTTPTQPFRHTQSPFNRNKFAPGFFDTPRQPALESSDVDTPTSTADSPLPADDSPGHPTRKTQYEKLRGARKPHDGVWKKRIQKSRKRMYLTGPSSKYDSDSEDGEEEEVSPQTDVFALTRPATGQSSVGGRKPAWAADPDLPYVASGYVQLVFNMFLVGVALYIGLAFIRTIQRDVDQKVEEYSAEILQEMAVCSKEYLENRCAPDTRVPAMEKACLAWEKCMNRDPTVVGRAKVSAETFAEIINSFIEPISYKTMIFCLLAVFGSVFLSNFAFGLLRHRDRPQPYIGYPQPPPQTPVQMPNLVMMSPWNGNTRRGTPHRSGSPRRKTSQKRDGSDCE